MQQQLSLLLFLTLILHINEKEYHFPPWSGHITFSISTCSRLKWNRMISNKGIKLSVSDSLKRDLLSHSRLLIMNPNHMPNFIFHYSEHYGRGWRPGGSLKGAISICQSVIVCICKAHLECKWSFKQSHWCIDCKIKHSFHVFIIFGVFREDIPKLNAMWIRFVCKGKEIDFSVLNKLKMHSLIKQTKFAINKTKFCNVYA